MPTNKDLAREVADIRKRAHDLIKEHGFMIQGVIATKPGDRGFMYTVGNSRSNYPEIIVFGMSDDTIAGLVGTVTDKIRTGEAVQTDVPFFLPDFTVGPDKDHIRLMLKILPNAQALAKSTFLFMDALLPDDLLKDIVIWQLLVPDAQNRLPGENGYEFIDQTIPTPQ